MRDALLMAVLLAGLITALRYPFAGVLVWAWFSLMTPHQLAFGVFGVPLNLIIAVATIGSLIAHGEFKQFRFNPLTVWLCLLSLWLIISQINSLDPANSAVYFDRFIKTLLFTLICLQTASSRLRVHALVWMVVVSLGYFATKGALFTLVTLGQYRVQGVPLSILEDNNHMGIALATVLPLILYLRSAVTAKVMKIFLLGLFLMTVLAVIGTQSRGAFISLVVFAGYFWFRSRRKIAYLAAAALIAIPAVVFMPSNWHERMSTIASANQDSSFMGRVDSWVINTKFALKHPITGAGLRNPYQTDLAMKVDPVRAPNAKAAHSIYFELLGGAGFVGLFFYLGLLTTAFLNARKLARNDDRLKERWENRFGYYAQMSLAVFFVGGASTSMEMWDGYLIIIALIGATGFLDEKTGATPPDVLRKFSQRKSWRATMRARRFAG